MKRVDFFSGETPLEDVSPPISNEEQMASIGQQVYGGAPVNIGGVSYNNYGPPPQIPQIPQPPNQFMYGAPYQGIGYNQYNFGYYQPPEYTQYGYSPYNTPQPNPVFGNPAFGMMGTQMAAQDVTINIPPYNPWGSEYLYSDDFEDKSFELEWKYWMDQTTSDAERRISNPNMMNNFGFNYYGNQYYSTPFSYNNGNKYIEEYNRMIDEARQRRLEMNMNLFRLAHNYLGEDFNEDTTMEMLNGRTITVPGITNLDIYEDTKLRNLIPFDNSYLYRQHDAKVSEEFRKRISPDADMNTCFENLALVAYDMEMEEELHRRNRDLGSSYDSNSYKTLIRQKVFNEKVTKESLNASDQVKDMRDNLLGTGMFPTLSQNARLADDGTLNITYSYSPGQVNNLNESQYQQERARFNSFLNSIPNALGGG